MNPPDWLVDVVIPLITNGGIPLLVAAATFFVSLTSLRIARDAHKLAEKAREDEAFRQQRSEALEASREAEDRRRALTDERRELAIRIAAWSAKVLGPFQLSPQDVAPALTESRVLSMEIEVTQQPGAHALAGRLRDAGDMRDFLMLEDREYNEAVARRASSLVALANAWVTNPDTFDRLSNFVADGEREERERRERASGE